MSGKVANEGNKVLSESDKDEGMSDTAFYREEMRLAFPAQRYGGAKSAIYAAYRYIKPKVTKEFTERRARAIWEGAARRIDAEEARALRLAKIEEMRRERNEIRGRLERLEMALARVDAKAAGGPLDANR